MHTTRLALGGLLAVLAVAGTAFPAERQPAASPQNGEQVTVRDVTYTELGKLIRGYRGKVVVVDFWADYWGKCKEEFPHLVQMHRKYARDGLVAVSVALLVDPPPPDSKLRGKVEKFLREQKATFTNVILLEGSEDWSKKLNIEAIPCVYIFDRDNHWVKKLVEDEVNYDVVEKEVIKLLGK